MYVSPPALDQNGDASAWAAMTALGGSSALPLYQPGLPALTMHNNLVRVPIGRALEVVGIGPFSIANNRLSTGGAISASSGDDDSGSGLGYYRGSQNFTGFLTALIVNMGSAIEVDAPGTNLLGTFNGGKPSDLQLADFALSESSSGAVEFTNNVCQLETRASGAPGQRFGRRSYARSLTLLEQPLMARRRTDGVFRRAAAGGFLAGQRQPPAGVGGIGLCFRNQFWRLQYHHAQHLFVLPLFRRLAAPLPS